MSQLISVDALNRLLGAPDVRIADTRFDLADLNSGRRAYKAGHIPGALFLDLDFDLSAPVGVHGGRHPLPDTEAFAALLGRRGIGSDHQVVVYDDGPGVFAGRLWWMLRYLGLDKVRVLDGGLAAWREAGLPLTSKVTTYTATEIIAMPQREMAVDRDYVLRHLEDPSVLLIDAREERRYRGEVEPIDPVAGHIPSAVNLPYEGNLREGRFLGVDELRSRYAVAKDAKEVIVYCGSGVSATHDLLALEESGFHGARLYVGSWSDWTSYRDAPVASSEES